MEHSQFPRKRNIQETQIFAGNRRFSFRRKPQKTADFRREPQIGVCPLRFVPLSAALESLGGHFGVGPGEPLLNRFWVTFFFVCVCVWFGARPSRDVCMMHAIGSDSGRAKGAAKALCGETVVQKGVFGESVSSLPP